MLAAMLIVFAGLFFYDGKWGYAAKNEKAAVKEKFEEEVLKGYDRAKAENTLDSCRLFGQSRFFVIKSLAISMLLNAACVAQFIVLARGMNIPVSTTVMFVAVPIVICISALPISPNGLGVRENLFVQMLAVPAIGVDPTAALSLSLLAYAGSLFWSLIGGLVYLTMKDRKDLSEISLEQTRGA